MADSLRFDVADLDAYQAWAARDEPGLTRLADKLCRPARSKAGRREADFKAALFGASSEKFLGVYPHPGPLRKRGMRVEMQIPTPGRAVTLVSRIDGVTDDEVVGIRTTSAPVDVERYRESAQWRAGLLGAGLGHCRYEVYRLDGHRVEEHRRFWFEAQPDMADVLTSRTCALVSAVEHLLRSGLVEVKPSGRLERTTQDSALSRIAAVVTSTPAPEPDPPFAQQLENALAAIERQRAEDAAKRHSREGRKW